MSVSVRVGVSVGDRVETADRVAVGVCVGLLVRETDRVALRVAVQLLLWVSVAECVAVGVAVAVKVGVADRVRVADSELVGVADGVGVTVGVPEVLGVNEWIRVWVPDVEAVRETERESVDDTVTGIPMRKMRNRTGYGYGVPTGYGSATVQEVITQKFGQ